MHTAFAGLRHRHIFELCNIVKNHPDYTFAGAFEDDHDSQEYAVSMGMDKLYQTYEELLADPSVESVALGGCFGDRGHMAIEALRAGKHVIADKPLCTTLRQLDEIERPADSILCSTADVRCGISTEKSTVVRSTILPSTELTFFRLRSE